MADRKSRRVQWGRRARTWFGTAWLALSMLLPVAHAEAPSVRATAPADLEEHVNRLASELRCLVCQNQTVADSQSELAVQLKSQVRTQLASGASDQQVREFMVQRYGDFVLYKPPVSPITYLLWGGPVVLLGLGAGLLWGHWRDRRRAFAGQPDSILPDQLQEDRKLS